MGKKKEERQKERKKERKKEKHKRRPVLTSPNKLEIKLMACIGASINYSPEMVKEGRGGSKMGPRIRVKLAIDSSKKLVR